MKKEIRFTVGTNFDLEQIEHFIEINERYQDKKIASVYGSLSTKEINLASARPNFRLGKADRNTFEQYVKKALAHNISIDYTANASMNMSIADMYAAKEDLIDTFKYLESVGVKRVIVANPLLMELIADHTSLKIKASTILGINHVNAVKYYADLGADRICPDIYINRNIPLLKAIQAECEKYEMELELLVNEICFFGDVPCNNVLRGSCYTHSSMGGNEEKLFGGWPFDRCQRARAEHPECMLKIPCVLPCHLEYYKEHTGISNFKISGRTNTKEYLLRTIGLYMDGTFEGSIEELFMLPQNTKSATGQGITLERLQEEGFFDKVLSTTKGCDYRCHTCQYCDKVYEKLRFK